MATEAGLMKWAPEHVMSHIESLTKTLPDGWPERHPLEFAILVHTAGTDFAAARIAKAIKAGFDNIATQIKNVDFRR